MARYWHKDDVIHEVDPTKLSGVPRTTCGVYVPGFTAGNFFISEPFTDDDKVSCLACIAKRKYAP